jgi:hypothetical protein
MLRDKLAALASNLLLLKYGINHNWNKGLEKQ